MTFRFHLLVGMIYKIHFHILFGYLKVQFTQEKQHKCMVTLVNKFQDNELIPYQFLTVINCSFWFFFLLSNSFFSLIFHTIDHDSL